MANFLAPIINDQQENSNGAPLSGGTIEVYLAGSSTPATTYSDQAGLAPNTWPIVLNTLGVNNQGAVWLVGGFAYKFIIKDSTGVVQRTIDNVSGINDSTSTLDQWIPFATAPTYVSATSFTVAGDQRQIFQIGRRVRTQNTSGFIYSTITNSTYLAPNTTVTVRNDSGVLDTGLSQVSYGIISVQDSSLTGVLLNVRVFNAGTVYTPTTGTNSIIVEVQGGGGGGGGTPACAAGQVAASAGGNAGSYCKGRYTSGFSGATISVGVAGGGGGVGGAGAPGGTSSFVSGSINMQAPGGAAGTAAAAAVPPIVYGPSATGTIASGGNILNMSARQATPGLSMTTGSALSGAGADSLFGAGGGAIGLPGAGSGTVQWGAGGGGALTGSGGGGFAGGTGGPGAVIVWEYS